MVAPILDLTERGFTVTDSYGDGVIRMAKSLPSGDESVAWLHPERGLVRPPALVSDYREAARRRIASDSIHLFDAIC